MCKNLRTGNCKIKDHRLFAVKKRKIADKNNKSKKINKSSIFISFLNISVDFVVLNQSEIVLI